MTSGETGRPQAANIRGSSYCGVKGHEVKNRKSSVETEMILIHTQVKELKCLRSYFEFGNILG